MSKIFLEIRDRATFIPALAFTLCKADNWLAGRAGFGDRRQVILMRLTDCEAHWDVFSWGNRTMRTAHQYIEDNWERLDSGDVVDVEHILGESSNPKRSEREDDLTPEY